MRGERAATLKTTQSHDRCMEEVVFAIASFFLLPGDSRRSGLALRAQQHDRMCGEMFQEFFGSSR